MLVWLTKTMPTELTPFVVVLSSFPLLFELLTNKEIFLLNQKS